MMDCQGRVKAISGGAVEDYMDISCNSLLTEVFTKLTVNQLQVSQLLKNPRATVRSTESPTLLT